jgi:hypothetical protein
VFGVAYLEFEPRLLLVASWVACAVLFEQLARAHFGAERARLGSLWLGFGTITLLATSRLPFALGTALGLAAALALQRGRPRLAVALAFLSPLASPEAGLFTAMGGAAYAVGSRGGRRSGIAIAAAAFLPPVFLSVAFPEGGWAPFPFTAYVAIPIFCAACLVLLPREERVLRAGAVLYALGGTLAVAAETPVGGTAPRLGMLFGGPLLLCVAHDRLRRATLPLLAVAAAGFGLLAYWQWTSAIRDIDKTLRDPAAESSYSSRSASSWPRSPTSAASRSRSRAAAGRTPRSRRWCRSRAAGSASSTPPPTRSSTAAT